MSKELAPAEGLDLGVLPACQWVVQQATSVHLDEARLVQLAQDWVQSPWQVPNWDWEIHWRGSPGDTIHYVLLLDALNFCFWADPGQPRWRVHHRGRWWNGYKGLAVALGRALDEGVPLTDATYLAGCSLQDLAQVLRGEVEIPLLEQRWQHAQQVGRVLLDRFEGDFSRAIAACDGSARRLTRLIADEFSCFFDVSSYRGRQVPLYKRAQITVVDLAGSLEFQGLGAFDDLDHLTAFADYKIPQVLRALGVLSYAPPLAERVDAQLELAPGCEEEVEIRAAMVWAVERIRLEMAARGRCLKAYEVDWFLWNLGQSPLPDERPYHRTRTVFY